MSTTDIQAYKNNFINQLRNTYNNNIAYLNNWLKNIVVYIKGLRINNSQKNYYINYYISLYNYNVNNLTNILNQNISNVQKITVNTITITGKKCALLIGINYIGTQNQLSGCIDDINDINARISSEGFHDINILTDNTQIKPTRENILAAFKKLLVNANSGDLLFFAYSGHGSYQQDNNGDETTGYDQLICPLDLKMIVDDELKLLIQNNMKKGVTLFAMFDSCFSGSVLDLKYQYMDSLNYDNFSENDKELETQGDVFMISGCTDYQTSADAVINNRANGAMTWSLLQSLKQKPNCSWRELIKSMRDALKTSHYDQIPQFSSGKLENIDAKVFI
jgi:metacaspase-1